METYVRKVLQLVHLTINGEMISTTVEHPFYIKDVGFVNAGALRVSSQLINSNGSILFVEDIKIELTENPVTVYNFQVEDWHTYHVGNSGVLVHNAEYTSHGVDQAKIREFNDSKVDSIMDNPSQKVHQSCGRTVYARKTGGYYDVVVTNSEGQVITCVSGNTRSLPNWKAVTRMLENQGGYSSLPID